MIKKLVTVLLSLMFCTSVFAGQIKQIIILGDSLSDNGNLYNVLKIIPKSPPYYQGRFTNGPTWAEILAKYYYDKSFADSENYAVGGATSVLHSIIHDSFIAPVTLTAEVYDYLARSLFTNKSNAMYIIWIGANDYLYERDPNMDSITDSVVANITWAMNSLLGQGAHNFVVINLPDLAKTPYAIDNHLIDRLHAITEMHNRKLSDAIKQFKINNPSSKIAYIDIYSVFNDLISNPEKYNQQYHQNVKNLTTACWDGSMLLKGSSALQLATVNSELKQAFAGDKMTLAKNFDTTTISKEILGTPALAETYATGKLYASGVTPCANANEYLFWDHIHPTEVIHQILAEIVEQDINSSGIDI